MKFWEIIATIIVGLISAGLSWWFWRQKYVEKVKVSIGYGDHDLLIYAKNNGDRPDYLYFYGYQAYRHVYGPLKLGKSVAYNSVPSVLHEYTKISPGETKLVQKINPIFASNIGLDIISSRGYQEIQAIVGSNEERQFTSPLHHSRNVEGFYDTFK